MHWSRIIYHSFPCCFSNCEILSWYVRHLFSWSTLTLPSKNMGSMWWLLYYDSTILLLVIAKYILALAAMVGSPSMTCSLYTPFWDFHSSDMCSYDWSLLLVDNWCSYNAYWVFSGLAIVTLSLLSNLFQISCPCLVPTWCNSFYQVVLIWSADALWP